MNKLFTLGIAFFACLAAGGLQAQEQPGIRDSLYSEVLQEQRKIYVNLPDNYTPDSKEKWDVVFVTDGEWNTESTTYIHRFARYEKFLPHAIIVGIPNTYIDEINQRDRDFLPVHMERFPISGKADLFLEFFRKELIPFIEQKYPASSERTLVGHSFGGVFAMYAILAQPDLFSNYIATDPPFHWNDDFMNKLAAEKLQTLAGAKKTLWISGIESTANVMGIHRMDSILQAHAPEGLFWKLENFPNETHNSVRFKGVYDGLKFAYEGYNKGNLDFHPMKGIVLKDKPFNIWLNADPTDVYYTTDGSEPTTASAKMGTMVSLAGPANFQLKYISNRGKWDKTTSTQFKEGKPLPTINKPKKARAGGFSYACYEGSWEKLPDFRRLKPVQSGTLTKDFDVAKLPIQENFACLIEGVLEIESEGYYLFGLDSDDGSKLYLGDLLLIDYDGLHEKGNFQSYILPLKKGFYPFRLEYFQKEKGRGLELIYVTPDDPNQEPKPIPLERQYSIR